MFPLISNWLMSCTIAITHTHKKHCTHTFYNLYRRITSYTRSYDISMAKLHCSQLYANAGSKFHSAALSRFINHRVQQIRSLPSD